MNSLVSFYAKVSNRVQPHQVKNIATAYTEMIITILKVQWGVFSEMRTPKLASTLVDLAQHIHLKDFRKRATRNILSDAEEIVSRVARFDN